MPRKAATYDDPAEIFETEQAQAFIQGGNLPTQAAPEKLEKFGINFLPSFMAKIDEMAKKKGMTRKAYINQACYEQLQRDGGV